MNLRSLPMPGAPVMDNLIATIIDTGNYREWLNLDCIAEHQGFDPAEFAARFAQIQTAKSLQPCPEVGDK